MPVINRIAEFHSDMTEWRRDLHRHPELALKETRTSGVVQEHLRAFGVDEVHTGLAGTGVVGVIRGTQAPAEGARSAIGLRAPWIIPVPPALLRVLSPLTALPGLPRVRGNELRRLMEDKAFPIDAMRRTLHVDPISLSAGLALTFERP